MKTINSISIIILISCFTSLSAKAQTNWTLSNNTDEYYLVEIQHGTGTCGSITSSTTTYHHLEPSSCGGFSSSVFINPSEVVYKVTVYEYTANCFTYTTHGCGVTPTSKTQVISIDCTLSGGSWSACIGATHNLNVFWGIGLNIDP